MKKREKVKYIVRETEKVRECIFLSVDEIEVVYINSNTKETRIIEGNFCINRRDFLLLDDSLVCTRTLISKIYKLLEKGEPFVTYRPGQILIEWKLTRHTRN